MKKNELTGLKLIIYKNRFTVLSLVIILGMFLIATSYHKQGGYKDWIEQNQITGTGQAHIGGDFTLTDFNHKPFTQKNLEGVYTLIFFGYTFCPDVCPTALSKMAEVYDSLDKSMQKSLNVVFISVDPNRDTLEVLKEYVPAFHKDFLAATGTKKQLINVSKKFLVYNVVHPPKDPAEPDIYMVDHSSYFYLMGPSGAYITHFRHEDTVDKIVTKLQQILYK